MSQKSRQYKDLRGFIDVCRERGELVDLKGVHWDCEIGPLTEIIAETFPGPPAVLYDEIPDYPAGYRVFTQSVSSHTRVALAMGLDPDQPKLELIRQVTKQLEGDRIQAQEVVEGPVLEHQQRGEDIDLFGFPSTQYVPGNGGRYIGTGCNVINRDPESGYVNVGTYRMQVHERDLLGLWMSPGQQGRKICESYWQEGKAAPVAATFGQPPEYLVASQMKFAWGVPEYEVVGALRGEPAQVIAGEVTGLPIPADAEIAIEGELPPPDVESREEGPFGEWPGYFAGGSHGSGGTPQPVVRVKAVYHRGQPIICDETPMWPGAPQFGLSVAAGLLWQQLDAMGVQGVVGTSIESYSYWVIVSIRQLFPGHAKQVGMAAASCGATARHGRYVVVVDEDIDPTNWREVMWALETRVDPAGDIDLVEGTWSTPLDPRMPQDKRASGDYTNSRAIFYATRPFHERDTFPKISRSPRDLRERVADKYAHILKGR